LKWRNEKSEVQILLGESVCTTIAQTRRGRSKRLRQELAKNLPADWSMGSGNKLVFRRSGGS
jgi:hypothetical protein